MSLTESLPIVHWVKVKICTIKYFTLLHSEHGVQRPQGVLPGLLPPVQKVLFCQAESHRHGIGISSRSTDQLAQL